MKLYPVVLAATLLGNMVLTALVLAPGSSGHPPSSEAGQPGSGPASSSGRHSDATKTTAEQTEKNKTGDSGWWGELAKSDLASRVAKLQEQGFPVSVIRAIMAAQIGEDFAARRKALTGAKTAAPFWQAEPTPDRANLTALRELSREQSNLLKDLLGPNQMPNDDPMYAAYLQRQFGNLPAEKVDLIKKVQQDYGELRTELYTAAGMGAGTLTLTPNDRAKMALLDKEQRADLQKIMTPEEFTDYELRSSSTASMMRFQLTAFSPTEAEFRTVFPLQQAFDERYRNLGGENTSPELLRQRSEAQKQLTAQIKAALGPERGADYERAIDGNFRQIANVVGRLDLPKEAAVQVWTTQKEIELRANAIRMDRTLPPPARNSQLASLAEEANQKVTASLGERGFEVYKQYGGYWLQNLQPRPMPGPPGSSAAPASRVGGMEIVPSR